MNLNGTFRDNVIKALASARAVKKKGKKAQSRKFRRILPLPIYVFDDSEQKLEFKARIKPCNHQPNCMKLYCSFIHNILEGFKNFKEIQ